MLVINSHEFRQTKHRFYLGERGPILFKSGRDNYPYAIIVSTFVTKEEWDRIYNEILQKIQEGDNGNVR